MLKKFFTHASQQFVCYSITSSALASKLGEEGRSSILSRAERRGDAFWSQHRLRPAADAARLPVPQSVSLKRPEDFKLIGTPGKRLDTPASSSWVSA